MEQMICTIGLKDETLELVIEQVDPGDDGFDVYSVVLQDEDGTIQIEYFEMEQNCEALDLLLTAVQRIQDGVK